MATDETNEPNDADQDRGKLLASWDFPEFYKPERSFAWYVIAVLLGAGLLIWAFTDQNYLFALIIIILAAIITLRIRREPKIIKAAIYEDGISVGSNTFYEWKDIRNFWIAYDPPEVKNLYIEFVAGLRPSITINLEDQNPLNVREILLNYLPEDTERENETFSDGFTRLLKL